MKKVLFAAAAALVVAAPVLVLAFAPAPDAGSRPVEHKTYNGYAESRDSGLRGDASFLALPSKTEFSRIFDPVLTPRGAPDAVAKDAFDTRLFVAVIKRGEGLWDYKVEKVTANGDTLTVHYRATPRQGSGSVRGETKKDEPVSTARRQTTARAATTEKATEKASPAPAPRDTPKAEPTRTTERLVRTTARESYSTERARGPSGTFDSPLILSVPKDKYLSVIFVENGKRVGTARVGN